MMPLEPLRTNHEAYLILGSNIDAERNLVCAVSELEEYGRVQAVSQVWQTQPLGDRNQADFLNAAVLLHTPLTADRLKLDALAEVERKLGRVRDPLNVNAARTIDIDVALFDNSVLEIEHRHIPDPDILTRSFVAITLAEIAPDYVHPELGRTLSSIAEGFDPHELVLRSDIQLAAAS